MNGLPQNEGILMTESEVYAPLLYACMTPSFVWREDRAAPLAMNPPAERLFRSCPLTADGYGPDLDRIIPGRFNMPDRNCHSLWLEFFDSQGVGVLKQVRNILLDSDERIRLTVLTDGNGAENDSELSPLFFEKLDLCLDTLMSSPENPGELISSLEQMITEALHLTDFGFFPSSLWQEYDIYGVIRDHLAEKTNTDVILRYSLSVPQETGCRLARPQSADIPEEDLPFYGPLVMQGQDAGFFYFEGLKEPYLKAASSVYAILCGRMNAYREQLETERKLYLDRFVGMVNDVVNRSIDEGIIITDESFEIEFINNVAAMMFGFDNSQVSGHKLSDLLVSNEKLEHLIRRDTEDVPVDYLHRRTGEVFPCTIRTSVITNESGNNYVFVISDQTDSEESRLKAEQLSHRAFLGDFSSMLAHEVRNPINNIRVWSENIRNLAEDNEAIQGAVTRINGDCDRVSDLVKNILNFSKPVSPTMEEMDLAMLLTDIVEKWRPSFARKKISCYFTPPKSFPKIKGDPRALEQVMNNLIGNSVDALGEQGGAITLKLSLAESEAGRQQVVITESDNGPGIPEDKIDKIFEPFMTTKKNGNGWGLALSQRIITSHKGTIGVKSFTGGTVFEIRLPMPEEIR